MKILLMGNPNVGKSVVFSRLTGIRVFSSNYPGTTVNYTHGYMKLGDRQVEVVDVPGTYTLEPTCEAEQVALRMFETGDAVVNVVNATNLERNLYLTLQLLEREVPVIVALNMWDDAVHQGIRVDLNKLHMALGVPVVPTVATTGEGIKELVDRLPEAASPGGTTRTRDERWAAVGSIVEQVQQVTHRHHTWMERLADASVRPLSGGIIAILILGAGFLVVRLVGENLIACVFDPLFTRFWSPLLAGMSELLGGGGLLHDIFIGKLIDGGVDFTQSFGLLSSGLYVPVAMVLPYVLAFYLVLGLLEDSGYLPRLAVLMDTVMHQVGLHGYAIIPTLLGFGCNVPAVLSTRILDSKRERFVAATLISIAIPCAALQAMILGLVGERGVQYVAIVYATVIAVWIILGVILRRVTRGFAPELLIEIPPYRIPLWRPSLRKLWMRSYGFLAEAIPFFLGGILVVNVLHTLGIFDAIANLAAPVVTNLLGLPKEAVAALAIGFLRKDVAVGMLAPLGLSAGQLVVGTVVLAMSFPCIATFIVMLKELGARSMLKSVAIMIASALTTGGILNLALN